MRACRWGRVSVCSFHGGWVRVDIPAVADDRRDDGDGAGDGAGARDGEGGGLDISLVIWFLVFRSG